MSVTKHKNDKLISIKVDINSEKVTRRSSLCSCSSCDSVGCFAKRHEECQCVICEDFKNCSALPKELNQAVDLKDSASKKLIRETITRETVESLKKVTETMYEFNDKDIVGKNLETKQNVCSKHKCSKHSECNKAPASNIEEDIEKIVEKECTQRPLVQGLNTHIDLLSKDNCCVPKSSAREMDVPYKDYKETESLDQLSVAKPLSKVNIFKRIKEIYDACSCKVCECISTKAFLSRNEICDCKPCECPECVRVRREIENDIKRIPHAGCPCVRCDRKDCRGIVKQDGAGTDLCDCSESLEDLAKPCDCEPCQCINCKLLNNRKPKTVRMTQFGDIFHKETCQCSPCECVECKQIYNRTNPTVLCSTSTNAAIVNSCRCEDCYNEFCQMDDQEPCTCEAYNSTVKKIFQTNCNDYDVRTVLIDSGGYSKQNRVFDNRNTIALFATVENSNPTYLKEKELCKCVDCECIVCAGKEETLKKRATTVKTHVNYSYDPSTLPTPIANACVCTPCECEICSRKSREESAFVQSKCKCDVCDCIHCDNASFPTCSVAARKMVKPIKVNNMNDKCACHPCECKNCNTLYSCTNYSGVKFYSSGKSCKISKSTRRLRKVMLVSPCTSETYLNTDKAHSKCVSITPDKNPRKPTRDIYQLNHVPHLQTLKNESDQNFPSNVNSITGENYYAVVESDVLLNVNNSNVKTKSCMSIKEESTFSRRGDINTKNSKTNGTANNIQNVHSEAKSLNYIHESPFKVVPRNSEDSIPMFWICPDESSHLSGITQDVKSNCTVDHLTSLRSTKNSSLRHGIASNSGVASYDSCERISNAEPNLGVLDSGNSYFKYFGSSNFIRNLDNCNNKISNEQNVLRLESYKYTDPFSMSVKNKNFVSHADLTASYEKATKVLQEAKAFSIKLVKMLDSFEKANRDFESASQKFRNLHSSLLDINEGYNTSYKDTFVNISDYNYKRKVTEESKVKDENEPEKEYEQCIKPVEMHDDLKQEQNVKLFTIAALGMNYDDKMISNTADLTVQSNEVKLVPECSVQKESHSVHKLKDVRSSKSTKHLLKNTKLPSLHVDVSKDFKENNLSQVHSVNEPTSQDKFNNKAPQFKHITKEKQQKSFPVTQEITSVSGNKTKIDNAEIDEAEKKFDEHAKKGERKSWDVLRKNLDLGTLPVERKKIIGAPALVIDVKEAIGEIALQVSNQEKLSKPFNRAKEALGHLMSEVNKILAMPLLQSNLQVKNDAEIKTDLEPKSRCSAASSQTYDCVVAKADKEVYFNSQVSAEFQKDFYKSKRYNFVNQSEANFLKPKVKAPTRAKQLSEDTDLNIHQSNSNCDAFKARFVDLRRVSDHTVLVKWALPRRVADVQGYELLVDGRAVQTILSRSRRLAVVTCLPPAERVLLTIRTLAAPRAPHPPAASVVYHPRVK